MSAAVATTTVEIPTSVVEAVREAIAQRDAGMLAAENADPLGMDRDLIDKAITAFAAAGDPFSANDLRHLLPDTVRPALWGARFYAASTAGRIRFLGYRRSTKKNTHGKPVGLWVGIPQEL
jgi:hypothetical protein